MEIKYKIISLDEVKYRFNYDYDNQEIDISKIHFVFSHTLQANEEKSEIVLEMIVKLLADESDTVLVEDAVRSSFYVSPFNDFIAEKNEKGLKVQIPELIDTFANITLGALRGILAKNLKGTPLTDCILPLVPMDYLRKKMIGKKC